MCMGCTTFCRVARALDDKKSGKVLRVAGNHTAHVGRPGAALPDLDTRQFCVALASRKRAERPLDRLRPWQWRAGTDGSPFRVLAPMKRGTYARRRPVGAVAFDQLVKVAGGDLFGEPRAGLARLARGKTDRSGAARTGTRKSTRWA